MTALEKLGKDVAGALRPPGERAPRQLAALLAVDWKRRRRVTWALRIVPALAVVTMVALLWLNARGRGTWATETTVELAGDPALAEGRWLQVTDHPLELSFADRTELRLERQSTARFDPGSRSEARLTLEGGELYARVEPAATSGRSWSFNAGPFRVAVIGTELRVGWSAEKSLLSVHVLHGRVQVRGGALEPNGLLLGSGDRLHVRQGHIELQRAAGSLEELTAAAPASSARDSESTPKASHEPAPKTEPARKEPAQAPSSKPAASAEPTAVSWQELARKGEYRQALTSAESEGFDSLVERLNANDLALLADAARLGGNNARARQALLTLRRRFPTVGAAQVGAFRLGRLALSQRNYAEAASWFDTYLKAAPSGPLAAEAAGRLIEARARAGNRAGAEAAARDYLRRFPGGPYESVAQGLLRGDKLVPR
jgi:transmembrane sensor